MAGITPLIRVVREGSPDVVVSNSQGGGRIASAVLVDTPGVGTFTYRIQAAAQSGSGTAGVTSATLVAAVVKR
jgi:hypothetical protein